MDPGSEFILTVCHWPQSLLGPGIAFVDRDAEVVTDVTLELMGAEASIAPLGGLGDPPSQPIFSQDWLKTHLTQIS